MKHKEKKIYSPPPVSYFPNLGYQGDGPTVTMHDLLS